MFVENVNDNLYTIIKSLKGKNAQKKEALKINMYV